MSERTCPHCEDRKRWYPAHLAPPLGWIHASTDADEYGWAPCQLQEPAPSAPRAAPFKELAEEYYKSGLAKVQAELARAESELEQVKAERDRLREARDYFADELRKVQAKRAEAAPAQKGSKE